MLERTAGCVEHAGRHIFRDSNRALRARKGSSNRLGTTLNGRLEYSQWRFAYQQTSRSQDLSSSAAGVSNDSQAPLGFLYPSQTQEFMAARLLRSSRCFSPRRKRAGAVPCRGFASGTSIDQSVGTGQPQAIEGMEDSQSQGWAKDTLVKLLEKDLLQEADRAWQLYMFAGQPLDLNSALLAQYSKSKTINDHERAKHLLYSIPEESRLADDYLNLTKSYLAANPVPELRAVCREAEAKGHGLSCWALALVRSIESSRWDFVQSIYAAFRPVDKRELWKCILQFINTSSIPAYMLDLSLQLDRPNIAAGSEEESPKFATFFIDMVFSTSEALEKISTDDLPLLLQRFHSAAVLTSQHIYSCLSVLQTAKSRSAFVRSIVIYRNFRWLMDKEKSHDRLLTLYLVRLSRFRITTGIEYFLQEYSFFNSRPPVRAYRNALWNLARAPDPSRVQKVFERLVADHGYPQTWELLTPLLYVRATVGNVRETFAQLETLSKSSGLEPNIYCWNIVLTAFAKNDDLAGCFSFFRMLLERGIKLDSYTFGIPMALCARRGDIDTVLQLLELAKKHDVTLMTPMLDTVVEAHCANKNLKTAEEFAESCLSIDVKGSRLRMWNLLLWNHAFQINLDSISRLRSRMDSAGIEPDDMTYAAVILTLVLLRQTDSARRILRTLHRSGKTHATEFHYVLVLYGYVRDRNRDMVHIIFREIQTRFRNPGLSSRLLLLRSQLQRDLHLIREVESTQEHSDADPADVHFEHAEKSLAEAIKAFDPTKIETKQPTPGTNRQRAVQAFPLKYYENVMAQYAKKGSLKKVEQLLKEFAEGQGSSIKAALDAAPLTLLANLMLAYARTNSHAKADELWEISYRRAREIAKPLDTEWLASLTILPHAPESLRNDVPSHGGQDGDELLIKSNSQATILASEPQVLPTYRFSLSRILSQYMRSLGSRNQFSDIDQVTADVERTGFSLTTFNWAEYVRLFASSDDIANNLRAFSIFEEKFMPAFPGWKKLKRLQGFKHSDVTDAIDLMEKHNTYKARNTLGPRGWKYWRQMYPDVMQPTYVTIIYLAAALLRARANSITVGNADLRALYAAAPKTIAAIAEMPHLRDKFQGVLLRNRPLRPDPVIAPAEQFVWTGGILGVGGRRRSSKSADSREEPLNLASTKSPPVEGDDPKKETPVLESTSSTVPPVGSDTDIADPHQTDSVDWSMISSEDQFDIQAQSALSARRRLFGTDDELLDDETLLHELSVDDQPDVVHVEERGEGQPVLGELGRSKEPQQSVK